MGDADVAYQVFGEGPVDLLYCWGLGSHVELWWESPALSEFLIRLASFSRLIFFDRRGTGASDSVTRTAIPTWEEWTEDVLTVLDAVGSKRTAVLGGLDGGSIAMLFAAMHPELVSALILLNTSPRFLKADDYADSDRPLVVLHVGDHDPSGVHLFSSAYEDVRAWAEHLHGAVTFVRVAVTPEQIEAHELPTAPPKATDRRAFHGETCQAEALDPTTLARIVTAAIEDHLDLPVLRDLLAVEETERDAVRARFAEQL